MEIDTVLQATDFLVMKGTSDTRVIPLPGFEVYDDARCVSDQAGAVIVLLGHSSGQPPHRPIVQTLALLPDSVVDDTATMVPPVVGEGTAKFAKDSTDINLELSLASMAQLEKINMVPPLTAEKILRTRLQWKVEKYVDSTDFPQDLASRVLFLVRGLRRPELAAPVTAELGPESRRFLKDTSFADMQEMKVRKGPDKHTSSFYTVANSKKQIELEFKKIGANWMLCGFTATVLQAPQPDAAQVKTGATSGQSPVQSVPSCNTAPAGTNNQAASTGPNPATNPATDSAKIPAVEPDNKKNPVTVVKNNTAINNAGAVKSGSASTAVASRKSNGGDLLSGLVPEVAGLHVKLPVASKTAGTKSSFWLDDEQDKAEKQKTDHKTPLATVPPGSKTALDKEKQDQEKVEKEKAAKSPEKSASGASKIAGAAGTGTVRLRSGPGLDKQALDEIPKGSSIQILGMKKGWYKVRCAGKTGYVFGQLVDAGKWSAAASSKEELGSRSSAKSESSKAAKAAGASETGTKASGASAPKSAGNTPPATASSGVVVHLMTVRDDNRRAISSVKVGERVVVLSGLKNHRYKIRKPDGTVGWVAREALDVKVETPPEFVP